MYDKEFLRIKYFDLFKNSIFPNLLLIKIKFN